MRVAVVGAGLAGLAAARELRASGHEAVVFEKSCGLAASPSACGSRRCGRPAFAGGVWAARRVTAMIPALPA